MDESKLETILNRVVELSTTHHAALMNSVMVAVSDVTDDDRSQFLEGFHLALVGVHCDMARTMFDMLHQLGAGQVALDKFNNEMRKSINDGYMVHQLRRSAEPPHIQH